VKPRGPTLPILLGLFALPLWAAMPMAAVRPAAEPRLILPGDRTVRAGELIDLRWARADSVSELEILLSLDGGEHYSVCISPRLDPDRCNYVWRVPEPSGARLRLRIRFNRGGREIEGAPSEPLRLGANRRDQPEPLGLPPLCDGESAPRPGGGRGTAPVSGPSCGPLESLEKSPTSRPTSSAQASSNAVSRRSGVTAPLMAPADRAPRFIPMRV